METANNFQDIIKPIRFLDKLFSAKEVDSANAGDMGVLIQLLEAQMNGTFTGSSDYMHNLFRAFLQSKKELWFNYDYLMSEKDCQELVKIMFHEVERTEKQQPEKRKETDYTNLLQPRFIQLFKQLDHLKLLVSFKECDFVISLMAVLSFIKETGIKRVEILAENGKVLYSDPSWMKKFWDTSSEEIIQRYKAHSLNIVYGHTGWSNTGLVITPMSK